MKVVSDADTTAYEGGSSIFMVPAARGFHPPDRYRAGTLRQNEIRQYPRRSRHPQPVHPTGKLSPENSGSGHEHHRRLQGDGHPQGVHRFRLADARHTGGQSGTDDARPGHPFPHAAVVRRNGGLPCGGRRLAGLHPHHRPPPPCAAPPTCTGKIWC